MYLPEPAMNIFREKRKRDENSELDGKFIHSFDIVVSPHQREKREFFPFYGYPGVKPQRKRERRKAKLSKGFFRYSLINSFTQQLRLYADAADAGASALNSLSLS